MKVSQLFPGNTASVTGADVEVSSLVYDSRRVSTGTLFAALIGARADGHDHVLSALSRGATAVLCQKPVHTGDTTRVLVDDSRLALACAARIFYADPSSQMRMVGVTGTNGKTITVHLLEAILAADGGRPGIIGTLGTRHAGGSEKTDLTTPESVDLVALLDRMLLAGTTDVAMEVSSHALVQERVSGVSFDVGVFLNLTQDHLDYHGSLESYFDAKARLFRRRLKRSGVAVLNFDDERIRHVAADSVLGFSTSGCDDPACVVQLVDVELHAAGIDVTIRVADRTVAIRSPLVGRFNVQNIVAATAAAHALGIDDAAIVEGVASLRGVPGRLERVADSDGPLIFVDYAHTPDALEKVLAAVGEITSGRLICVFGCGGDRDARKRPVMGEAVARGAEWAVVTSDNPRSEEPQSIIDAILPGLESAGMRRSEQPGERGYCVEPDRAAAIQRAVAAAAAGDVILVAGKGHETHQIIGDVERPFDDRDHARTALRAAGFSVRRGGGCTSEGQ